MHLKSKFGQMDYFHIPRYPVEGNNNPPQYSFPRKSHGWKSVVGYSPEFAKADMTEAT